MAVLSSCYKCGVAVSHRASEMPACDECSGKNQRKRDEAARWKALSVDEKLDELKARMDAIPLRELWMHVPIG